MLIETNKKAQANPIESFPLGKLAIRGPRICGVEIDIDDAIEGHRGGPCSEHGDGDPDDLPRPGRPSAASIAPRKANGRAKSVCSNLIISSVVTSLFQKLRIRTSAYFHLWKTN
jgi:hypothetical protein